MKRKNLLAVLTFVVIVIGFFVFRPETPKKDKPTNTIERPDSQKNPSPADQPNRRNQFDRRVSPLIYTKHARCRMACRHIDEREVEEILEKGRINYQKSDPSSRPDPKYALEGVTRDNQEVRIIFAPADRGMVVITVIDLEKEWSCDCK